MASSQSLGSVRVVFFFLLGEPARLLRVHFATQ